MAYNSEIKISSLPKKEKAHNRCHCF